MIKIRPEAYKFYFYFIQERMNIFWKKCNGENYPFSKDKILANNKFTNVYRACDRVSQYLISNVIYGVDYTRMREEDIILRILVFKIFNKIETWEYLENRVGLINTSNFNVDKISLLLAERIKNKPIFSNAYMMTGSHRKYDHFDSKHEKWLKMVETEIMKSDKIKKIIAAKSLEKVYDILNDCSFIGDFLAYQYSIDLNYSPIINFDENSFVKAGIGAVRGIKKCFEDLGKNSLEDAIKYTQDNFEKYQKEFGYTGFSNLFGRDLTLIDLQNCFCETDKYLRVALPSLQVDNVRIKQKYNSPNMNQINYFFPPKWGINDKIEPCKPMNSTELTLF